MPMIVIPGAPPVTPPEDTASPDGWLTAIVDPAWAGVTLSIDYTAGDTPHERAVDVRKVAIVRHDPGGVVVPVRSGDLAWAVEGLGTAYDHEAPLGVAVSYSATPLYDDGTWGPTSSVGVVVPAPDPNDDADLWLKSLETPGLSLRVMIVEWPGFTSAGRQEVAELSGSPYNAVAFDTHGAEAAEGVAVDVPPEKVEQMRELLRSGVLLAQVRPGYMVPDAFHVPADISGPTPTGKLGTSEGYRFAWTITPVERPDTVGQPMRSPGWSYDTVAAQFATYDALGGSYDTYASLATNGLT